MAGNNFAFMQWTAHIALLYIVYNSTNLSPRFAPSLSMGISFLSAPLPDNHVQPLMVITSMHCSCHTDARTLVLVARNFAANYPELQLFATNMNWRFHAELDAMEIPVGRHEQFNSVNDVANFLRGILDNERLEALRAAWLAPGQPLGSQMMLLVHAELLTAIATINSSPLLDILNNRRIETWFQPIFERRTMQLWGYECLMRGRDNDGNLVSAPDLIRWARQENLAFMLDRICRETHLTNAGDIGADEDCHFLINFLPTAIYNPEFCLKTSMAAAERSRIAPERVIFEVIETERITDREHLRGILQYYRERGFRVALDDVGAGYAGLALLADLHPDLIKIDRELISRAAGSQLHRDICESLVRIGKNNHQLVLAEGVETHEERLMMEGFGVDLFQGYLFGRPSPTPAREPVESFSEGYVPEVQASMAGESGAVGWPIESRDQSDAEDREASTMASSLAWLYMLACSSQVDVHDDGLRKIS